MNGLRLLIRVVENVVAPRGSMEIARFVDSFCNFCTELASGLRPHRDGLKWLISVVYGPFDASGYSVSGSIYMVGSMEIARFVDSFCNFCTELASGLRPHRDGLK
jgi:hypothetical protein